MDWEEHRPAVFGVAYRLLGSVAEAEDVVQETWLRAAGADLAAVVDLRAWLTTVAARVAYDVLKSARVRRERYVGPWLPEPLLTGPDVADRVVVDESVTMAMLVVMERLTPAERVAFVLHDVFAVPFEEIARVLGNNAVAARGLASRARRRIAEAPRAGRPTADRKREVLRAFRAAAEGGDLPGLVSLLHPDVVYYSDGGGKRHAARKPITGERVATAVVRVVGRYGLSLTACEVNGEPGLAALADGRLFAVYVLELDDDGLVRALRGIANPEKLRAFPATGTVAHGRR